MDSGGVGEVFGHRAACKQTKGMGDREMTIKRICDKCGKEDGKGHAVSDGDGNFYDLCTKHTHEYNQLWTDLQEEQTSRLDAWLKSK